MSAIGAGMVKGWMRLGPRLLPFADAVSAELPLGRLLRLCLFQVTVGMDAVLLSPDSCDPLYRRCVRVSMGQVFSVPYAYLERWPDGIEDVRAAGFRVLALTPRPSATDLAQVRVVRDDDGHRLLRVLRRVHTDVAHEIARLEHRLEPLERDVLARR